MRFMIVEDEYWQRRTIKRFLDTIEDAVLVGEFEDASSALLFFYENEDNVDIVIVDLVLPDYSGTCLAEHMKKRNPCLELLFISGEEDLNVLHECHFIAKPFKLDRFKKAIDIIKQNIRATTSQKTEIRKILNTED